MNMDVMTASAELPTHADIAARAYELYLERGRLDGHAWDDWLQAEYELIRLPIREIALLDPPKALPGKAPHKSLVSLVHTAVLL
jgi:Protein of unknown function (DUF2934)